MTSTERAKLLAPEASEIIALAEADLGHLTDGQRRDLLADNTEWLMEVIDDVVELLSTPQES